MDNIGIQILAVFILVLLNGYFAAAEMALISVRKSTLQRRAAEGSKGAKTALQLTQDPTSLLATIQIGITLVSMLASASAAVTLAKPIERWFHSLGLTWLTSVAAGLSVFVVTLAISYLTLVIGELAPKRLGLARSEQLAIGVAGSIAFLKTITTPIVRLLTASTAVIIRLLGLKGETTPAGVSEEEIKLLVTEQGSLLDEEKRMIHEIFELGDTVAREVMVPRVDMVVVQDTATVEQAMDLLRNSGFSRAPVFHEDIDKIVGLALLRELVGPMVDGRGQEPVLEHIREVAFVPESKGILPLLSQMQESHDQAVIVVDEYGGTAGLLTIEDITEEIVGEIADEFDRDHKYIVKIREGEWTLNGQLPIEDAMELGLPVEESEEYETLAGWLLAELGHIPSPGERYECNGYEFRVQAMRRHRIAWLSATAPEDFEPSSGAATARTTE